jgi:hypothetical protein
VSELWAPAAVLGAVALVGALTVAILVLASRRHRVSLTIRCPMTCLEPDECATATPGLPGNYLFKGRGV